MFSRALHVVGRPDSADTPSPEGPRHCGQFAAIGAATSRTCNVTSAARMIKRILTRSGRKPDCLGTESGMFDLQPVLTGELLRLRPLRPEDWNDLYAVASDPLIWEQHPIKDRYKEAVFKEFFREAMESGGALIVLDSRNGQVIGSSRFHGYEEEKSEIEIGWTFLARSHWGGIYNREMKQLMLQHAFRFVKSVIFLVGPQNFRSQRALEKLGGVRAGSRSDGSGRDSVVYQITARPSP